MSDISRTPFVGRDSQLLILREGLAEALHGRSRFFLVDGLAGVGKTRLVERFAEDAYRAGAVTLSGRAWDGGGAPPYWIWRDALKPYIRERAADSLVAEMGDAAADVAVVVPEIRQRLGDVPAPVALESEAARFRVFEAILAFLENASRSRPLMLAFEDLHGADLASLQLLRFVARGLQDARVLLVATIRGSDTRGSGQRAPVLDALAGDATRVSLGGLTRSETEELVSRGEAVPARLMDRIYSISAGNALFVSQIARLLQRGELDPDNASAPIPVPEDLRRAIEAQLDGVSSEARSIVDLAAVIGREFDASLVADVGGHTFDETVDLLDEARAAGLVSPVSMALGRYSFAHPLIRETVYEDLPPSERRRWHRAVGQSIERMDDSGSEGRLPALAYHFSQVAVAGDADKAYRYAIRAGDQLMEQLAYEEAAASFDQAFGLLGLLRSEPDQRTELLLKLATARRYSGDARSRDTFMEAARLARREGSGLSQQLGRAAMGAGGPGGTFGIVDHELVAVIDDALARLGDSEPALRADLLARRAAEYHYSDTPQRARELLEEAVRLSRSSGDTDVHARVLMRVVWALVEPDAEEKLRPYLEELTRLAHTVPDRAVDASARLRRICRAMQNGDQAAYDDEVDALTAVAEKERSPMHHWWRDAICGGRALMRGRLEEADRLAGSAFEYADRIGRADALAIFAAHLFIAARERCTLHTFRDTVASLSERYPGWNYWRLILAWIDLESGHEAEATDALRGLMADGANSFRRDSFWLMSMTILSELASSLGTHEHATELYELLAPYERYCAHTGAGNIFVRPIAHSLGLLAGRIGLADNAAQHFDHAAQTCSRMRAEPSLAHVHRARAEVLQMSGDAAGARESLARAVAIYERLEMEAWAKRAAERVHPRPPVSAVAPASSAEFRLEGRDWRLRFDEQSFVVRDVKGMHHLRTLLASPGREFHVLDLTGEPSDEGDPGALLDPQAKAAYKQRIEDLRSDIAEAEAFGDTARASRAQDQLDELAAELARSVGLGGRDNQPGSGVQRARVNVTRTISAAIERIEEHSPSLGHHLRSCVKTGTYCSYEPDPLRAVTWTFTP